MADSPRIPRTLAEFAELEAQVHVPFDRLSYDQAEPPAESPLGEYETGVRKLLFDTAN